jgi:hypothetical protein
MRTEEERKAYKAAWYLANKKLIRLRAKEKLKNLSSEARLKRKQDRRRYRATHKEVVVAGNRRYQRAHRYALHSLAANPPDKCPCCGRTLEYFLSAAADSSPSIDRHGSTLGYTLDNCVIICLRCNRLKKNITLQEIQVIIKDFERLAREAQAVTAGTQCPL